MKLGRKCVVAALSVAVAPVVVVPAAAAFGVFVSDIGEV